jgi:amino acid adenylation domain-containing protein
MTQHLLRDDLASRRSANDNERNPTSDVSEARPAFSCILLGEEPLAARCADVLAERGHRIVGVVSNAAPLRQWARARNIPAFERNAYRPWLETQSFDLLLSITHPNLIEPGHIGRARVAALNYHDGPLPRYAGMNGSAWALASGENRHAIVWHHLTAGLDDGDIVEWRDIDLDGRETSLSLNMQSSAQALDAFNQLIRRLERGDFRGTPQAKHVPRLVFSRHDRPKALCALDLHEPAERLDCLIRACDFGPYDNRFGLPKLVTDRGAVLVLEAALAHRSGGPGDLHSIDSDGLELACGRGALVLRRVSTLAGRPLSPTEAAEVLGATPGERLVLADLGAFDAVSRRTAEAEPYFVGALRSRVALTLPFDAREQPSCALSLELPRAFQQIFADDRENALLALLSVVLGGACHRDAFGLALVDATARAALGAAEPLFYPSAPFDASIDARAGFAALVRTFGASRARLAKRGPFLWDLCVRHPDLARDVELMAGRASPVVVVLGEAPVPEGSTLALSVTARGVALSSGGRLDKAALSALAGWMNTVASAVAESPERPLAEVSLLNDAERRQQVFGWNDKARSFPDQRRLHDGFEAMVAARPDAVALVFDGQELSFREVEEGANRIANVILRHGVGAGERVGLYVERSFELIFALLGVAKSGAAYVPLDTAYPEDRVNFMLNDAGCRVVLCSSQLVSKVGGGRSVIDVTGPEVRAASPARPQCETTADRHCYTIYTSGSTGRPKGVVLTHRAVVNTIDWVTRELGFGPHDRLLFVTSPSFDLSVFDVFGALGAGASVEVASKVLLDDPAALAQRLMEPGITVWDSAPPALARLAPFLKHDATRDSPRPGRSTLRKVMLSGDWIPVWLPGLLQQCFPSVGVHSFGGATEAAIWSNHYYVESMRPSWTSVPYGYPIQNCRYYVLDHHLRPLPVGVAGDLYIAGVCLAEGYLNRDELTRERFIPDPFVPGERMYKTGDLSRYWPDSTLEFLGRADSQVKIRGFRVELGEIESALVQLPDVLDAVCTVYVDASDQKSLVAYLVAHAGKVLSEQSVRAALAERLPEFMLPSHFVVLPALPLSPNGKVDRKALPSPSGRSGAEPPVPPRNDYERRLVDMWKQLLKKDAIGIRDDFFALGGHSLLAVMLITRIKEELGVELKLTRVLERPTIESLAECIEKCSDGPPSIRHLVALSPSGTRPPIIMVAGIGGYAFTYAKFGSLFSKNQPLFALQAVGIEGEDVKAGRTIEEVGEIYLAEVTRERPEGPLILAGFSFGALAAFELAVRLEQQGREVPFIISFDGFAPGYPRVLPWPERIKAHALEFVTLNGPERREYLAARLVNVRARVRHLIGRGSEEAEDVPFADTQLNDRLKHSWANHMQARRSYRTTAVAKAGVLLIRAEIPERWAATTMHDPLYGWHDRVQGPISTVTAPGNHLSVMTLQNQELIVNAITRRVDEWLSTRPGR